jgi:lipoic acid synthetase
MCSILVLNSFQSQELPRWLVERMPLAKVREKLRKQLVQTETKVLCETTHCPNLLECYSKGVVAFQILGTTCSRKCSFCSVPEGLPQKVDESEIKKIAKSIKELGLKKVVLTSAPRDDLIFGGAGFFSRAIQYLKNELGVKIEAQVPDFQGSKEALKKVVDARPDIINHSLEMVPKLYPTVYPKADYNRSLEFLAEVKEIDSSLITKSGFMLGLGETDDDILKVMEDLRQVVCDLLTIGQYISPSENHFPVHGFVLPKQFEDWKAVGRGMGFKGIASAPLVRSSYQIDEK